LTNDLLSASYLVALAARYHEPQAAGARRHRLVVLAHPSPEGASKTSE